MPTYELGTLWWARPLKRGVRRHTAKFSEGDSVPWHYFSGASRPAVTPVEGRSPKLMRRMPVRAQRRNTAYLNHRFRRFGWLDRELEDRAPMTPTGLAIDLEGSLQQRLRPAEAGSVYLVYRHS